MRSRHGESLCHDVCRFGQRPHSRSWRSPRAPRASPLYRVYEDKFSFAPTTLTLLFTVYIVVLLGTLLLFGSVSDYTGRRIVMLAGLALGAAGCGLFLIAHRGGPLFAAPAPPGVAGVAPSPAAP